MAQKKHKRQRCSATGVSMRDKLAYQRELKAAIDRQAHDVTLEIMSSRQAQRVLWLAVISMCQAYQIGEKRMPLFFEAMEENRAEYERMVADGDLEYADEKLRRKAEEVSHMPIKQVYQDGIDAAVAKHEQEEIEL